MIPLFAKGLDHVTGDTYPAEWEDFGAACHDRDMGCKRLDQWVFDRLTSLFASSKKDPGLASRLRGDGVVIFLHLLGLDMNGHAHRPNSHQYRDNIRYVAECSESHHARYNIRWCHAALGQHQARSRM